MTNASLPRVFFASHFDVILPSLMGRIPLEPSAPGILGSFFKNDR